MIRGKLEEFFNVLKDQFAWVECRSDDTREKALNKIIEIIQIQQEYLNTAHTYACDCCTSSDNVKEHCEEAQQKIEALLEDGK